MALTSMCLMFPLNVISLSLRTHITIQHTSWRKAYPKKKLWVHWNWQTCQSWRTKRPRRGLKNIVYSRLLIFPLFRSQFLFNFCFKSIISLYHWEQSSSGFSSALLRCSKLGSLVCVDEEVKSQQNTSINNTACASLLSNDFSIIKILLLKFDDNTRCSHY